MTATMYKTEKKMKTYTKKQVKAHLNKTIGNGLVVDVLTNKYLLCDENENYYERSPEDMWDRLSKAIVKAEKEEKRDELQVIFRRLLEDFKFVPAGRILYGLGNPFVDNITLKNCYVLDIKEDSIEGIFKTIWQLAETYKAGGGCGIDISNLRPSGSPVRNAARYATGPVSFMDLFSHVTGTIGQKARIGAMIISLDVSHPDIEQFIDIKSGDDLDKVRYANISVRISDRFMNAVENDEDFNLEWKGKVYKTIKARELWNRLINKSWSRGEPGILFWDTVCRDTPAHVYPDFKSVTTNPCGEAILSHGESCNLGSINLGRYVNNSFIEPEFDYEGFSRDVKTAVRFLDNIITLERAPLQFQQEANDNGRRLGLGVMGVADMFLKMKVAYDSPKAMAIAENVFDCLMESSYEASCDLAVEKGSFPSFNPVTHLKSEFIQRLPQRIKDRIQNEGLRNISINSIAPTGSISCIAQCSSGIEPVFAMSYTRKTNMGTANKVQEHKVFHRAAQDYLDQFGEGKGVLPSYFVSAHDIDHDSRIKLQSIFQRRIDQAISNTVNLKNDCKEEEVAFCYEAAWRRGCKGITVYRDGCREGVLVTNSDLDEIKDIQSNEAPKRPDSLDAKVHLIKPNGKMYTIFVGMLNDRPYEVFALDHNMAGLSDGMVGKIIRQRGDKKGVNFYHFEKGALQVRMLNRYEDSEASLITRLISTALRHGTPIEFLIDQMAKSKVNITSMAKALARALSLYIRQEEVKGKFKCIECDSNNIKFEGTCKMCHDCGWSSCS